MRPRIKPLLIVGESPSKKGDGRPLSGPSGKFLADLMGITHYDLFQFDRVNLCSDGFNDKEAQKTIKNLNIKEYDRLLLLGNQVSDAFKINIPLYKWVYSRGTRIAKIPHPSKLNRLWNDPSIRDKTSNFLKVMYSEIKSRNIHTCHNHSLRPHKIIYTYGTVVYLILYRCDLCSFTFYKPIYENLYIFKFEK